ncbi:MAG: hypothetical protein ABI165_05065, partial [Bryobacteraceae bacterium]
TNHDDRIVTARLLYVGFETAGQTSDILQPGAGLALGPNWYPEETSSGQHFRWVSTGAQIYLPVTSTPGDLQLDLEAGPGCAARCVVTIVGPKGKILLSVSPRGRETVTAPLAAFSGSSQAPVTLSLLTHGGGTKTPGDPRVLNFRVFGIAVQTRAAAAAAGHDIVLGGSGIQLRSGWYPPETYHGELFRWVDNDAIITVPPVTAKDGPLQLELEPGPGAGGQPLVIRVLDPAGRQVQAAEIHSREILKLFPPVSRSTVSYRLQVEGGGKRTSNDPRILNFRVFRAGFLRNFETPRAAAFPADAGITLGTGWYPLETFQGETFRWVNNDAAFMIRTRKPGAAKLALELEPGPGMGGKPLLLKIFDAAGRQVQSVTAGKRQTVELYLPAAPGKSVAFRFHVDGGGRATPGDPRILNFRVFKMRLR